MAGGIDWFRWHHGSVTDQKFPLVAKRAGASVAEVIAVWACVLEAASMNAERGTLTDLPDFESMDCALGLEEGRSLAIFNAMCSRNLIDQHLQIVSWPKRQPKRERDDDTSTERVRAFRDRERHETPRNANENNEAPTPTKERQETPRGEERREEEIQEPTVLVDKPAASRPACPTSSIVDLYHEHLPMLPRVEVLNDARKRAISARWREVVTDPDIGKALDPRVAALDWFAWFFGHCAQSRFLTGRAKDWRADIDFLMAPRSFARAVEGVYHKEAA